MFEDFGISQENEEIFRNIMFDGEITDTEISNLDFEQTQQLAELRSATFHLDMPILDVEKFASELLFSTVTVGDDNLNKAIYQTFKDDKSMTTDDMLKVRSEFFYNVSQSYNEQYMGLSMYSAPVPYLDFNIYRELELDFSSILMDMLDITSEKLKIEKIEDTKERVEVIDSAYREILKNYNEFKSEN